MRTNRTQLFVLILFACAVQMIPSNFCRSIGNYTKPTQGSVGRIWKFSLNGFKPSHYFHVEIEEFLNESMEANPGNEFSLEGSFKSKSITQTVQKNRMKKLEFEKKLLKTWDWKKNIFETLGKQTRNRLDRAEEADFLTSSIVEQFQNSLLHLDHLTNTNTINNQSVVANESSTVTNHVINSNRPVGESIILDYADRNANSKTKFGDRLCKYPEIRQNTSNSTFLPDVNPSETIKFTFQNLDSQTKESGPCYLKNATDLLSNSSQSTDMPDDLASAVKFPLRLPSYMEEFIDSALKKNENQISHPEEPISNKTSNTPTAFHVENATTNSTSDLEFDDFLNDLEFSSEDAEPVVTPKPILLSVLHGIVPPSDVSFINETRNGLIRFVFGFNRLTIVIQITIVIVITIVIIIIGNGVYQLVPYNLFWALLAALLPMLIMLLLQSGGVGVGKKRKGSRQRGNLVLDTHDALIHIHKGREKYDS